MTYRFYIKNNASFLMTERNSRCPVAYYSKYKMNELYPDGGYEVIGEIGNLAKKYSGQDTVATDEGKNIPIFPRGSMKKPFEWVAGYAAVAEDTYVAVIKSVIPRLI
jgi:phospholipase/carboxylesterase